MWHIPKGQEDRRILLFLAIAVLALALGGCAMWNKYDLRQARAFSEISWPLFEGTKL
jgi:hypothetical protein